jgi:hypothetical protein
LKTDSGEGNSVGISFKTKISLSGAIWENARIAAFTDAVSSSAYGALAFYTMNATTLSERMRIGNNGFIGINTSSPDTPLHIRNCVNGGTNNYILTLQNTCTISDARVGIAFLDNSNTAGSGGVSGAAIQVSNNGIDGTGNLLFSTLTTGTNCERMRITSGGNVGIGTTDPGQKLEVVGGEIKAGRVDSSSEGGQVSFGRASDNATGWYIDVFGSTSTPSLRFVDVSNSAVRMVVDGSGITCFQGTVCAPTIFSPIQKFEGAPGYNYATTFVTGIGSSATFNIDVVACSGLSIAGNYQSADIYFQAGLYPGSAMVNGKILVLNRGGAFSCNFYAVSCINGIGTLGIIPYSNGSSTFGICLTSNCTSSTVYWKAIVSAISI